MPSDVSEEQVLKAIENAVRILCPSFVFGHYGLEDIQQEARLEGWRVMPRYDPKLDEAGQVTRPLENYIYTCIRNRLIRLKRDKLRRNDPPCKICWRAEGNRTAHPGGEFCKKFLDWKKRNDRKANLMRPLDLDRVCDEREPSTRVPSRVEETAQMREVLAMIDEKLDVEMRATWLQIRAGKGVPKARRLAVEKAIKELIGAEKEAGFARQ